MNFQYVTDIKGKTTAVLLSIRDWKAIEKKLSQEGSSDEDKEPTKKEILESIRHGLRQVKLHLEGKIKLQSAKDFLDEL